ncbi:hypothetical protein ACFODL_06235 [Phenylobacterium terrae]|uniref:Uncharacterized protein n=1 Tax=Phenylobacterium terrae TaxID=2665495 RepID=A0ABW4N5W6_9CAUL
MLSPQEFTVGTFATAKPGSLVLPRAKHEAPALICEGDGEPVAVVLSGTYAFHSFPTGGAENWRGVIVPDVSIELDETSLYDPDHHGHLPGVLVREGTRLMVRGMPQQAFGRSVPVVIHAGLPDGAGRAAFTRWQVILGQGDEKRVLHQADLGDPPNA